MSRKLIKWLSLLFSAILCGCASPKVDTSGYMESYPQATDPRTIEVFHKKPADRKFNELAEITVDMAIDWEQVERIFRSKGAEFGADAVYVLKKEEHTSQIPEPHDCHFSYDPGFQYGSHFGPYNYGYRGRHFDYRYPSRYYYCYGDAGREDVTYMKVIGVAIRYAPEKERKISEPTEQ